MPIEGFVQQDSFYIPLQGGGEGFQDSSSPSGNAPANQSSIDLLDPNNVFELQNTVSDKLNKYQIQYSRYMKCQDPSTSQNMNPACTNDDNFENVTVSYYDLMNSIDTLNSSYVNQKKVAENNSQENYQKTMALVTSQYAEMVALRKNLDRQLAQLQYNLQNNKESPKRRLDSMILGYILWIILATCLIYFVFVG